MKPNLTPIIFFLFLLFSAGCAKRNFYAETPVVHASVYEQLKQAPETVDSVTVKAGEHYNRSWFHNVFWGKHYRPVWAAPVTVPVFDMDSTKGGLAIEKKGGGFQTTSFALVANDGFTYALRSLDKDPVAVVSKGWQKSFVANILRDQTSAANPYAALVIPPMAAAADIPHSTPQLVYVQPNAASFGKYKDIASDKVYMIEEKYNDKRALTPMLGNAEDIVGSKNVLRDIFSKNDHFIDQKAFAKARLFDILINDWDRHRGQWEWSEHKNNGETYYRPIPKDRDNAFYRFQDGLFPWIFSRNWAIRKFESFDEEINDVKALAINSEFIDKHALSRLTRQDFIAIAKELQATITDEVIERAVRQYPESVYKLVGESTARKLKSRRDQLDKAAQEYYELLAEEVVITGTDNEEEVKVKRLNDNETAVTVYRNSDDQKIYQRTFYRSETDKIIIYGLAEDDEFEISGNVKKGIEIVIVGGRGEDEIKDTSSVKGWSKKTKVYDTKRGNEIKFGSETKDKTNKNVKVHLFDREGF